MKFKKIEIQAFRVYDKASESTFDFESNGKNADFVSIYAPNGFGKTSFYDAVEWAYTNNISRFLRNDEHKDDAKAERISQSEIGKKPKHYIIRNKYSNLDGYVKLYTTNGDYSRNIPVVRAGQPDFKFDPNETEKEKVYFLDVLLAQEWLDAFLRDDNAESRYSKFIDYFGDKELDNKYKTIIDLINANTKKIDQLKADLKKYQIELRYDLDSNILNTINEKIELINLSGENLTLVDLSFADREFLMLTNQISDRKISLSKDINAIELKVKTVDEKLPELTGYLKSREEIVVVKMKMEELRIQHIHLNTKKQLETSISDIKVKIQVLSKEYQNLLIHTKLLESYRHIKQKEVKQREEIQKHKTKLEELNLEISKISSLTSEINIRKENIEKQIIEREILLKEIPIIFNSISVLSNDILTSQNLLANSLKDHIQLESEFKIIKLSTETLKLTISNFSSNIRPSIYEKDNEKYIPLIKLLDTNDTEISKCKERIDLLTKRISSQQTLNKDLKQLISLGTELINKNKLSSCPLCTSEYSNYESLSAVVTDNPAIENDIKVLLEERVVIENLLSEFEAKNKEYNDQLKKAINQELVTQNEILTIKGKELKEKEKLIGSLREGIASSELKLGELKLRLKKPSQEEFNSLINEQVQSLKLELLEILEMLNIKAKNHQEIVQNIAIIESHIAQIIIELERMLQEPEVKLAQKFLNEKNITDFQKYDIVYEIKEINVKINTSESQKSELMKKMEEIGEKTIGLTIELIDQSIGVASNLIKHSEILIASFEQILFSQLKLDISKIPVPDIESIITDSLNHIRSEVIVKRTLLENFEKLDQFKVNVMPFIKQRKIEQSIKDVEFQVKFHKENVASELKKERNKLSDYIHKQVESFFYEDLINKIYAKIDPHPEYKSIKFKCDFSNDKPRLNVFVTGKETNYPIIPNLYFSTAQLNVLSLSIFLAKALNVKDEQGNSVDCIFIDDPIQSMDSINILSTIDLLRSIVVNMKKQIILSTHDENFYKLLQKKIPIDIFNSKFIELETFGKIKP